MSRIVSVSVSEEDFSFIKGKNLSPTGLFRGSVERVRNKLGDGFYNAQQKELEEKIQRLNNRLMDAVEFINLHGLEGQYVVHIEKQEAHQRRVRAAEQKDDGNNGNGGRLPPTSGQSRDEYKQV